MWSIVRNVAFAFVCKLCHARTHHPSGPLGCSVLEFGRVRCGGSQHISFFRVKFRGQM